MRFESITIHYFSKRIEDKRAKMLQNFNNQKKKIQNNYRDKDGATCIIHQSQKKIK